MSERIQPVSQVVGHRCSCGRLWSAELFHYGKHRCPQCGVVWWALQPRRRGPLVARLWPGGGRGQDGAVLVIFEEHEVEMIREDARVRTETTGGTAPIMDQQSDQATTDFKSVAAEQAVARVTRLKWNGNARTKAEIHLIKADVGENVQVRSTAYTGTGLRFYQTKEGPGYKGNDDGSQFYFLARTHNFPPTVEVVGFLKGVDCVLLGTWQKDLRHPCYEVPGALLTPPGEFR